MSKEVVETVKEVVSDTAVQGKLVEMLDSLQHGAVKVGEEVVKYSPDIANTALWVVRIDGIQTCVMGVSALVACYFTAKTTKKLWALDWTDKYDGPTAAGLAGVASGLVTFLIGCFAAGRLLDVWVYIAIAEPKLYLAKQVMHAALK